MTKYKIASVSDLADAAAGDATLQSDLQNDPVGTLRTIASALHTDPWVYRIVVAGLSFTLVGVLAAATALAMLELPIPDVMVALGSGALGALAGLLAPSPAR